MNNSELSYEGDQFIELLLNHIGMAYSDVTKKCNDLKNDINNYEQMLNKEIFYESLLTMSKKVMGYVALGMTLAVITANFFYNFIIKYPILTLVSFGVTAVSGIGYGIIFKKLKELTNKIQINEGRILSLKDELENKLIELNNIKINRENFMQKRNILESDSFKYLKKERFEKEYIEIFLGYLENNFSLISLLVLANDCRLPKKSITEMNADELNNLKSLLYDTEKKIRDKLKSEKEAKSSKTIISEEEIRRNRKRSRYTDYYADVRSFKPIKPEYRIMSDPKEDTSEVDDTATIGGYRR